MFDLIVTFVLFFAALAILHILLFTRWRNKSKYFWKATDYVWMSLAIVSLATLAMQYHQQEEQTHLKDLEVALEREYDLHQARLLSMVNIELQHALVAVEESHHADDETILQTNVVVIDSSHQHLTEMQLILAENRPYEDHVDLIYGELEQLVHHADYQFIRTELEQMIAEALSLEGYVEMATAESERFMIPDWVVHYTPFVLAPALALRLTKVTAESYIQREQDT